MSHFFLFFILPTLLVLGVGVIVLLIALLILFIAGAEKLTKVKLATILSSIIITLALLEFLMRLTGFNATYMEKRRDTTGAHTTITRTIFYGTGIRDRPIF